ITPTSANASVSRVGSRPARAAPNTITATSASGTAVASTHAAHAADPPLRNALAYAAAIATVAATRSATATRVAGPRGTRAAACACEWSYAGASTLARPAVGSIVALM